MGIGRQRVGPDLFQAVVFVAPGSLAATIQNENIRDPEGGVLFALGDVPAAPVLLRKDLDADQWRSFEEVDAGIIEGHAHVRHAATAAGDRADALLRPDKDLLYLNWR